MASQAMARRASGSARRFQRGSDSYGVRMHSSAKCQGRRARNIPGKRSQRGTVSQDSEKVRSNHPEKSKNKTTPAKAAARIGRQDERKFAAASLQFHTRSASPERRKKLAR